TAPPIPELGGVCRFVAMAPAPCLLGGVMSGPSDDTASLGSCEPANGSNESRIERSLPTSLAPFWYAPLSVLRPRPVEGRRLHPPMRGSHVRVGWDQSGSQTPSQKLSITPVRRNCSTVSAAIGTSASLPWGSSPSLIGTFSIGSGPSPKSYSIIAEPI